ncbi:MAG: hypothetical protein ABIH34_03415 [Nanoarchaeota archaeon]
MKLGKTFWISGAVVILIIFGVYALRTPVEGAGEGIYDDFARCLTDKGAIMYGAYWCSHCNDQKKMFGASVDLINYVECSLPDNQGQTAACAAAGIESYPTWEFPDGSRQSGALSIATLSQRSGCSLTGE